MSDSRNDEPDTYCCDLPGCELFRVYCAVVVPASKMWLLDEIILSSRRGLLEISEYRPGPFKAHAALLFMNSLPPGTTVKSGSHVPLMRPFPDYPLAGKSLKEVYDWHCGVNDLWFKATDGHPEQTCIAMHNFAVVDERTMRDGTILLCSDSTHCEPNYDVGKKPMPLEGDNQPIPDGLATLRSDGFGSLIQMVPDEVGTYTIRSEEPRDSFVFTEQYNNFHNLEYRARIQAKIARGERLRRIEEMASGLKDPLGSPDE